MYNSKFPFEIVFISGAPRSGTTIAHALICTSSDVNNYVGECSYLSQLVRAFDRGMETFDVHTRYFFDDRTQYTTFHRELSAKALISHWEHLGKPNVMALKDPDMLPIIPSVATLFPEAIFVIIYRDPRDVIASRIKVQVRRNPEGNFTHSDNISALSREFVCGYQAIESLASTNQKQIFVQEYEQLVNRNWVSLERYLGIKGIDPSLLWQNSAVKREDASDSPWASSLYFEPLSRDSIGLYKQSLDPDTILLIEHLCGQTTHKLQELARSSYSNSR